MVRKNLSSTMAKDYTRTHGAAVQRRLLQVLSKEDRQERMDVEQSSLSSNARE